MIPSCSSLRFPLTFTSEEIFGMQDVCDSGPFTSNRTLGSISQETFISKPSNSIPFLGAFSAMLFVQARSNGAQRHLNWLKPVRRPDKADSLFHLPPGSVCNVVLASGSIDSATRPARTDQCERCCAPNAPPRSP